MKLYRSDWIGIGLGVALGIVQPYFIFDNPIPDRFNGTMMMQVCAFGLIGPPTLAFMNKVVAPNYNGGAAIGKHVNAIFLIAAFGATTGIVGTIWYLLIGGPKAGLISIGFFGTAGIGFGLGYLVNPQLAHRPEGDT